MGTGFGTGVGRMLGPGVSVGTGAGTRVGAEIPNATRKWAATKQALKRLWFFGSAIYCDERVSMGSSRRLLLFSHR